MLVWPLALLTGRSFGRWKKMIRLIDGGVKNNDYLTLMRSVRTKIIALSIHAVCIHEGFSQNLAT